MEGDEVRVLDERETVFGDESEFDERFDGKP